MKNKIWCVNKKEFENLCIQWENDEKLFIAVLDGDLVQNWNQYLDKMYELFQMPNDSKKGVATYLDWMRDLEWLQCEGYILVINNYKKFIGTNTELKKSIIKDFEEYILPFWEEEVVNCVVGGYPKLFNVFLVE